MSNICRFVPKLTVNGQFMRDFMAEKSPCFALGLVEERKQPCGFLALRPAEVIPPEIAMTLLAFSVRIPDQGVDLAKLPGELTRMWNEFSGLVFSFAIAAMFWVGHFRLLRSLSRATVGLIYLSLFQLFWIVVLPFRRASGSESKREKQ